VNVELFQAIGEDSVISVFCFDVTTLSCGRGIRVIPHMLREGYKQEPVTEHKIGYRKGSEVVM
jgi:hypothetical protein